VKLPRWLDPRTNAPGWSAALGLAYATWQAITAAQAHGPLTWKQAGYIAAGVVWAAVSAYTRSHVTTLLDPRDGNGNPLVPAGAAIVPQVPVLSDADLRGLKELLARVSAQPATFAAKLTQPVMTAAAPAAPQTEGKTTP
jgi:hypothetical protein